MEAELSQEAEEYIETIYKLQKRNGMAKTKDLAETMHVVPGSITNTIEHLEKHDLVTHEPYRGVKLTSEGEKIALSVIRKHRLAERLLTDVLDANWTTVHDDACKLEHALTKNLADLLDKKLGYPKFCPHGNPIPTEDGFVDDQLLKSLAEGNPGEDYRVIMIVDEENMDLKLLADNGVKPEAHLRVVKRNFNQIFFKVKGKERCLDRNFAARILVEKLEGNKNAAKT